MPVNKGQGVRLAGKLCVITGAAQGIGRAIAEAYLAEGAHVIAIDLQRERLWELEGVPGAECIVLDVRDARAVEAAAAACPNVNVLVNCAGFVAEGTLLEASSEEFDRSFAVNVETMFNTMRAFLPHMIASGGGSIVNVGSVVSDIMAAPRRCLYGASKAAVLGLTKSVALDYASQGIRCNVISPGTVETPSLHERIAQTGDPKAVRESFISRQLMGRFGRVDEIAALAVLLASDEAQFITGSNIVIDGGMSL